MLMTALRPQIRRKGSFHPKVWLWAFKHDLTSKYKFRLLVTSRNLTRDTDFDAAVVFESKDERPPEGHHRKLFDLFDSALPQEWRERLNGVTFSPDMYKEIKDESRIHTVVSPFLDAEKIEKLTGLKSLFSTRDALDSLDADLRGRGIDCFVLRDLTDPDRETGDKEVPHFGLHAKLYFSDSYLFLGSRNCTDRGWYENVEFMVRLGYGQKRETLLNSLVYDPDGSVPQMRSRRNRAQALFEPYAPQYRKKKKNEAEDKRSELIEFLRTVDCMVGYRDDELELEIPDSCQPGNMPLVAAPLTLALRNVAGSEKEWRSSLTWKIDREQRSPFFSVRRRDLPGFSAILIAKPRGEADVIRLEDYVGRVKAMFTYEERLEYLCSLDEVPLDDLEIVGGRGQEGAGSEVSWRDRDHRFLERLVQNAVAHPDSVERICAELNELEGDPKGAPGVSELSKFFNELNRSRGERHE